MYGTWILTCYTTQYREAKYVQMVRVMCRHHHNHPDSISACNRSIPGMLRANQYSVDTFGVDGVAFLFRWNGIVEHDRNLESEPGQTRSLTVKEKSASATATAAMVAEK